MGCEGVECEERIRRVKAEFLEMPGLKLTVPQAQRRAGRRWTR